MSASYLPFTKLLLGDEITVALTGNGHIQVLANGTGAILHSTLTNSEHIEKVTRSGTLVEANVDKSFKYLVTVTSDKTVRVWEILGLKIVSEREAAKKPTDVCFTHDAQTILITDKFGDVHRYPLTQDEKTVTDVSTKSLKRMAGGTLLLGHVSMLTTLLLSEDEKYIITADRDEHIRVSWYPEAFTIESYCLGHKKFVSSIHLLSWDTSLLVSGGGDPTLKVWKWLDGTFLYDIGIYAAVIPFIKVVRKKPGRGEGSDNEEENGEHVSSRQKRKNKKKTKAKKQDENDVLTENVEENVSEEIAMDEVEGGEQVTKEPKNEELGAPILAVQKILSLEVNSHKLLIFSVHGATALFYCRLSDSDGLDSVSEVRSIDVGKPILDFEKSPRTGVLLIAVDNTWREFDSSSSSESQAVIAVRYSDEEFRLGEENLLRPLVSSLNSEARVKANSEALQSLDYYSALTTLPKNVEVGYNAMDDELLVPEAQTEQLSGKELGRLKSKKAMLALQSAQLGKQANRENPEYEPDPKRPKNELTVT